MSDQPTTVTTESGKKIDGKKLKPFILELEQVDNERTALGVKTREINKNMKDAGFDPAVVKTVISRRKRDRDKVSAKDRMVAEYEVALGMATIPLPLGETAGDGASATDQALQHGQTLTEEEKKAEDEAAKQPVADEPKPAPAEADGKKKRGRPKKSQPGAGELGTDAETGSPEHKGAMACIAGKSLGDNPFKQEAKRVAWETGFQKAHAHQKRVKETAEVDEKLAHGQNHVEAQEQPAAEEPVAESQEGTPETDADPANPTPEPDPAQEEPLADEPETDEEDEDDIDEEDDGETTGTETAGEPDAIPDSTSQSFRSEGAQAADDPNLTADDNPYPADSKAGTEWNVGYNSRTLWLEDQAKAEAETESDEDDAEEEPEEDGGEGGDDEQEAQAANFRDAVVNQGTSQPVEPIV